MGEKMMEKREGDRGVDRSRGEWRGQRKRVGEEEGRLIGAGKSKEGERRGWGERGGGRETSVLGWERVSCPASDVWYMSMYNMYQQCSWFDHIKPYYNINKYTTIILNNSE